MRCAHRTEVRLTGPSDIHRRVAGLAHLMSPGNAIFDLPGVVQRMPCKLPSGVRPRANPYPQGQLEPPLPIALPKWSPAPPPGADRGRPACRCSDRPGAGGRRVCRNYVASVAIITKLNRQIAVLQGELADHFEQHPGADVYLSLPGIGGILGARSLGEFGDDPDRYAMPSPAKTMPGPPRSLGNQAPVASRWHGSSAAGGWPTHWSNGPFAQSPPALAPAHFMINDGAHGDSHHKPYGPWPTDGPASSTAAYATTPPMTNTPPGPTAPKTTSPPRNLPMRLDS